MATVTKPIALDESFNTTEVTPRNIADVLAEELGRLGSKTASDVEYDNTDSGLVAENVQDALDEINGKVVQSDWEQADPTKDDYIKNKPTTDLQTAVDSFSTLTGGLLSEAKLILAPVQSGSGTPSPDNIRPISGHTEARLDVSQKNKFNPNDLILGKYFKSDGTLGEYVAWNCIYIYVEPNTTYTISGLSPNGGTYFCYFDKSKNFISNGGTHQNATLTTPNGCYLLGIEVLANGTEDNVQVEKGSTATPYEPYKGASYVTPLGQTIYTANIDMVSGECDVIGGSDDLGALSWSVRYTGSVNKTLSTNLTYDYDRARPNITADDLKYIQNVGGASALSAPDNAEVGIYGYDGAQTTKVLYIVVPISYTPTNKIVYELATPQHIQLSPQLIQTLVGENNLSAPLDGQTIDEVKYRQVFTFEDVVNYINGQGA